MNEMAVRVENLTKVYRLYARPHYRFLDMFGLLGNKSGAYTEHAALRDVSLEVRRGTKVAIIGRNGAGKSTLLKLITRVISPTAGRISVAGKTHALLQIGTGFHPDFTGRQNVEFYLAQMGVTGREAQAKVAGIVDFSELEEYIDQPIKTYSSGMVARLMFSTSTAITPDILILDEVLGVGDAYFSQKSYERISSLCEREESTLLLVTHDLYSASRICSRVIWIDRGSIIMDGEAPTVVKAYEDSIRAQEEQRLRLRKQEQLKLAQAAAGEAAAKRHLIFEVFSRERQPLPCPVFFEEFGLSRRGESLAGLRAGDAGFEAAAGSHLQREATCWGSQQMHDGRWSRPMLNFGSPYHKVAAVFALTRREAELIQGGFEVTISYASAQPCNLHLRAFLDDDSYDLGALPPVEGAWARHTATLGQGETGHAPVLEFSTSGVLGSGAITVQNMTMLNEDGVETSFIEHGRPAEFVMDFRIADPSVRENAQVSLVFHRDGVQTACRLLTRDLRFDGITMPEGKVRVRIPKVTLGNGTYTVSVLVAEEGYYDRNQTTFYAINPELYFCLSRILEIRVSGGGLIADGTPFIGEGTWSMAPKETPAKQSTG